MKKNIVALAVASAIAAPVVMADAPTVYGQINMAIDQKMIKDVNGDDDKANSGTQVNSRASRIGIKGANDLGSGLKAVYKAEFEVQIDESSTLKNRNQYVGLAGGFGTVLMGRHDTPFKMAQGKDFFNDSPLGDIGKMAGGLGAFGKGGENRVSNVLAYVSPSFGGVKIVGAFVPKEDGGNTDKESSLTDLMSFAAMYGSKKKGLYLSAAMDIASKEYTGSGGSSAGYEIDQDTGTIVPVAATQPSNGEEVQHVRVVAQYAVAGLIANAMYQDFSGKGLDDTAKKGSTISVGAGYKIGNFMPKVQVMMVDRSEKMANGDDYKDSTNYALGLDYSLGKKTTAYVEYVMLENEDIDAKDYGYKKAESSAFSIGMKHKF
jgi:predicted porin